MKLIEANCLDEGNTEKSGCSSTTKKGMQQKLYIDPMQKQTPEPPVTTQPLSGTAPDMAQKQTSEPSLITDPPAAETDAPAASKCSNTEAVENQVGPTGGEESSLVALKKARKISTLVPDMDKPDENNFVTRREFQQLQDEVRRLQRKLRELLEEKRAHHLVTSPAPVTEDDKPSDTEQQEQNSESAETSMSQTATEPSHLYKGYTMDKLKDIISHMDTLYDCVHCILLKLFDKDYIISHSVSGQRANTNTEAKPKFDEQLFSAFVTVIKAKFPQVVKTDITAKVQAVQKKYHLIKKRDGLC